MANVTLLGRINATPNARRSDLRTIVGGSSGTRVEPVELSSFDSAPRPLPARRSQPARGESAVLDSVDRMRELERENAELRRMVVSLRAELATAARRASSAEPAIDESLDDSAQRFSLLEFK